MQSLVAFLVGASLKCLLVQQDQRHGADFHCPGARVHLFESPKNDEGGGGVGVEVGEVWQSGIGKQVCSKNAMHVLQQLEVFISPSII